MFQSALHGNSSDQQMKMRVKEDQLAEWGAHSNWQTGGKVCNTEMSHYFKSCLDYKSRFADITKLVSFNCTLREIDGKILHI